VITVFSCGP